ncbi:MAG TPA: DUF4136 domain-containing protein [Steroidobacteraceae bacterium]|jgi:hypothetical protein|nr:DUF4136 domain-containing protein [Steroidobacteraceae bacterium]
MQYLRSAGSAVVLAGVLGLASCATGPDIRVDKDPSADMASYKTFGFFDALATDRAQYSTIITSRLKQATRTQLEAKGYRYEESNPDLKVNFYVKVQEKQEIQSTPAAPVGFYGYRAGYYGAWAGYPQDIQTYNYREGTLSIDLVDAKKDQLAWQGVANGRISDEMRKNPGPAIDAVVAQIFSNFPNPPAK